VPDWYFTMRATRYLHEPFSAYVGTEPGNWIVEQWARIAEEAELEAQAEAMKHARDN
jgi:hypothetical protein